MKTIYKLIYWFICFQLVIILVHAIDVFPPEQTFYSDIDLDSLSENVTDGNIPGVIGGMFAPPAPYMTDSVFTIAGLVTLFVIGGTLIAWKTQSFAPIVIIIIGITFYSMFIKSISFFKTILTSTDNHALWVLGMILMIGVVLALIFAIVETPTHGES